MKQFAVAALLLILSTIFFGCSSPDTNNSINPSYRLLNTQILEIDSALGLRGGLAALTQTSTGPVIPEGMLHGSSLGTPPEQEEVKLNWALIGRRVSTIDNAWADISAELDRRSSELSESWGDEYLKYFRIMAAKHDFDTGLGAVKLDVSEKNKERIELSVAILTQGFIQTKEVLGYPIVDHRRVTIVSVSFVSTLVGLTIAVSLIARHRDRRFILSPTSAKQSKSPRS